MRTAEEILKENTGHAHGLMDAMVIKSMKEFALEVAKEALRNAADRADKHFQFSNDRICDKIIANPINIPKI